MLVPLPRKYHEFLGFSGETVPARDASTIAVVRDGEAGIEAFLMRRQASMEFAAGMYVFPGGGVWSADAAALPWVGPDADYFASRIHCSAETAHSLVVAAVRETFEETGVLLAGRDEHDVVSDTSVFHDAREALESQQLTFAEFLKEHRLVLRADLMEAWSHWITPAFEPRRYDTRFFVTVLPEGQRIDSVGSEADRSVWAPIHEVLGLFEQGKAALLPPTISTCRGLSPLNASTMLGAAAKRTIRTVEPVVVEVDGKIWLDTRTEE